MEGGVPHAQGASIVSAVSADGGVGIVVMLTRSLTLMSSFFTEDFLKALGLQVDQNDLVFYLTVIFLFWVMIEQYLRHWVEWLSAPGLGWKFSNVSIIDFIGSIIMLLWFGNLSNVLTTSWISGAFSVSELIAYGLAIAILFFTAFTIIKLHLGDMVSTLTSFGGDTIVT